MKKLICLLAAFLPVFLLGGQNLNVAFRSKMTFPGQSIANVWGYTAEGREYALL
ncbi:MAG: hypothetical protein JNK89_02135, partial [Saprospiraceae bacterium]|nr:hypothetical protein [Saprospiraceae bacterium]